MTVITILFVIEHVTTLSCIFFFRIYMDFDRHFIFFCTINYYFNALCLLLDIRFLVLIDF